MLSIQGGLIGDTAFAREILAPYDTLPSVKTHALSSPYVRNHLFGPLDSAFAYVYQAENYPGLIYGKGGQAAMILDRYLLEKSGGKASIYDLIRSVVRGHGSAFHRSDLIAETDRLAGGSSAEFLTDLLDRVAPLDADSLARTYKALRARGRFGPGGGKLPIPGIDPAPASTTGKHAAAETPSDKDSDPNVPAPAGPATGIPRGQKF